jgi:hypothetical protein
MFTAVFTTTPAIHIVLSLPPDVARVSVPLFPTFRTPESCAQVHCPAGHSPSHCIVRRITPGHTMSALGAPPPGKKPSFLPFKRTAKRRTAPPLAEVVPVEEEDESLSIFNQRKVTYFDDQQKLAAEKASRREQAREEQATKDKGKGKAKATREDDELPSRGSPNSKTSPTLRRDSDAHSAKRKRIVVSSGDKTESDVEIFSRRTKTKPTTPEKRRTSLRGKTTAQRSKPSRSTSPPDPNDVISLNDSDDEPIPSSVSGKGKEKTVARTGAVTETARYLADDASSDEEIFAYGADDLESKYIREARERMAERKKQRLAREENSGEQSDSEAAAEILIESRLEGIPNLKIKIQISKKMQLVREAWAAKSKQRLQEIEGSKIRPSVIDAMFFTWKGNKIYDFTTLSVLGIKPVDDHGSLFPSSQGRLEGYIGWDKVHIEAWTQELYDQHQAHLERESRRRLGDLDEDDMSDAEPEPAPPVRLRIVLRSKDLGDQPLRVPPDCTVKLMIKAFRAQRKDQLQPNQAITLHFDGDVLDEATMVQDTEIEDGDVVEVHL